MASPAQFAANRANAQRSTGPTSPEGKARSARNARSHGLTSTKLEISESDRPVFDRLEANLRAETAPATCLEEEIFHRILAHTWNLARIENFESNILAETDPFAEPGPEAANLDRFARYRRDLERSLYRAIAELRKLQTERAALFQQHTPAIEAILESTPLAEVTRLTKQTQSLFDPHQAFETKQRFTGGRDNAIAANKAFQEEMDRREAAHPAPAHIRRFQDQQAVVSACGL
ncbi:hypothetical protein [uncultured Paludibaculum sp.]|uniref:hypothetical protein n=1 Tax=uncultured Paludibaculum sp. TaxID=1765020 RepID=UPI002AAB91C4|nr:hypothetical protein [uncultured Paludibaculum sp.]